MTKNDRKDVWNAGTSKGIPSSSSSSNTQTDGFNVIKHVGTNRTIVNGSTYYGASSAKKAINDLK